MSARLTDIQEAWITDAKANITGLKTAASHEKEFDGDTLAAIMPTAPFALFRFVEDNPDESQRLANGASGMSGSKFMISLGAHSLISKKEGQKGCYDLLDDFKDRYDGFTLAVTGGESVHLAYGGRGPVFSSGGVMVYYMIFSYSE